MQPKPAGWISADIEPVPAVTATFASGTWPPARDGWAGGQTPTGDWQVTTRLSGGGLPEQVRGASGGSIPQGSFTMPQPSGAPLTPWARDGLALTPGGLLTLTAEQPGSGALALGTFQARQADGSSTTRELAWEIEGEQERLKRTFIWPWQYDDAVPEWDAAVVVERAAEQGGYSTLCYAPSGGTLQLWAPLNAVYTPRGGTLTTAKAAALSWRHVSGMSFLASGTVQYGGTAETGNDTTVLTSCTATITGAGGTIRMAKQGDASANGVCRINLSMTTATVITAAGTRTVTLNASNAPVRRLRVDITTSVVTVTDLDNGQVFTTSGTNTLAGGSRIDVIAATGGGIREVVAGTGYAITRTRQSAYIDSAASPIVGAFNLADATCWSVITDVASKTMNAAWIAEDRVLVFRNRERLRGGSSVETIIPEQHLESLDWTISVDDVADRVELTYTPAAVVQDSTSSITLWEATSPILVTTVQPTEIEFDLEGSTDRFAAFLPIWDTSAPTPQLSRWAASPYQNGNNPTNPSNNAIRVTARLVTPSRVKLTITNTTSQNLWLVDGSGNPCLIVRTSLQVLPGETQTISTGLPPEQAIYPKSMDCGQWVQDPGTAQTMLAWLASQLQTAQPTLQDVRVKPDLTRQIGDIVVITEQQLGATHQPLKSKALIVGVQNAGTAAQVTQSLSLAMLGVSYDDHASWAAALGLNTYDKLTAWWTANNIRTWDEFCRRARDYLITA